MNVNFELYRIFYTVAKNKNITRAAEELNISQPAISKSIKNLEEQLGGQLFTRTKKGVVLTDAGSTFYNYIRQAVDYINNAENKFTDLINLETGTINIGIGTTLTKKFLLPYLEIFHKSYPKINIQIYTNVTSELISKLRNGLIDIVIINLPINTNDDIEIIECQKIQDCFVANNDYKDLKDKQITLKELNNYPLVLQTRDANKRKFLDKFAKDNGVILTPQIELGAYALVEEFAKIGMGIAYVTKEYIDKEIKNKKLFVLDVIPKIPIRYVGMALSRHHLPSFSTKKLIEIILGNTNL